MKPITVIGPYSRDGVTMVDVQVIEQGIIMKHTLIVSQHIKAQPWIAVEIRSTAGVAPIQHLGYAAWDYWRQLVNTLSLAYRESAKRPLDEYNHVMGLNGYEQDSEIDFIEEMTPEVLDDE
jgi:hypothetical protein